MENLYCGRCVGSLHGADLVTAHDETGASPQPAQGLLAQVLAIFGTQSRRSKIVSAVARDGALCFGTDNGAPRFDGVRWKTCTEADGLCIGGMTSIVVAADGAVLFAACRKGAGVSAYQPSDRQLVER